MKGKLIMPREQTYDGDFKDDLMHGVGKITYHQENITYEGIFKDGNASNIGRVTYLDEDQVYIGELEEL